MKEKKQNRGKKIISLFLLISLGAIIAINSVSAESFSRYSVGYSPYTEVKGSFGDVSFPGAFDSYGNFDRRLCDSGQDFLLYVSPLGCTPSVVRSDLLEEQNVPVFCPITSTQLNPLISVEAIDGISFRGDVPAEVSGVGYYPAQAALGQAGLQMNQPIMDEIGYAVIVLKQQKNESAMPNFVEGNLTARISYDIQNAFGLGQATFYLPQMNDDEWNRNFRQYSFWQGRGYLRAESIGDDSAVISIYSGREEHSTETTGKRVWATTRPLEVGETSREMLMPGFDYCMGGLQLRLDELKSPDTTVRLNVNGDFLELQEGEKFLDNKCFIPRGGIEKRGVSEKVTVKCREDEGTSIFDLSINPRVVLSVGDVETDFGVGDKLFETESGEKSVYLVYITTKDETKEQEDLAIALVELPEVKEKLSDDELRNFAGFFNRAPDGDISSVFSAFEMAFKSYLTIFETIGRGIISGESFRIVSYPDKITDTLEGVKENAFGKEVRIVNFAGAIDVDFSGIFWQKYEILSEFEENYENAVSDYNTVIESHAGETYPPEIKGGEPLDQQALYEKIVLVWETHQKSIAIGLCKDYEERYPNFEPPSICSQAYKYSSSDIDSRIVEINGRVYSIMIDGVKEPTFDELGAVVSVRNPDGDIVSYQLRKEDIFTLDEETGAFIQLIDVDKDPSGEDSAKIRTNIREGVAEGVKRIVIGEAITITLKEGFPDSRAGYVFSLQKVNLQKVAKVSVVSNVNRQETEATFPFKIGIEKRAIQLSPEKTEERIESLNKTIEQWSNINDNLGNVVKVGKAACFATGTFFVAKNFFANLGGEGTARQIVMRESGGWFEQCEKMVNTGEFPGTVEECLSENNEEIEGAIDETTSEIEKINKIFSEEIPECEGTSGFLGEKVVNTNACLEKYLEKQKPSIEDDIEKAGLTSVSVQGKEVLVSDILDNINSENTLITQARDIELYSALLNSEDQRTREIARTQLNNLFSDVWINAREEVTIQTLKDKLPENLRNLDVSIYTSGDATKVVYSGKTTGNSPVGQIPENTPAHMLIYNGIEYTLQLEEDAGEKYRVVDVYDPTGTPADEKTKKEIQQRFIFQFFDADTYKNKCPNCEIRYYQTGAYEGLPAIVPFDKEEGWYAAIKPILPLGGGQSLQPYDDSGRVTNFYLCNVGSDGREDFFKVIDFGGADDVCRLVNLGTGQAYDQFPGVSSAEAQQRINDAQVAFRTASAMYNSGLRKGDFVSIMGQRIKVGDAAIGTPDIQCQDFMSPSECNILFNVCDPFICPSSRCDLGGAYPVDNVIQSGVIGSMVLCLPNFPEVKVPVCVSGVYAGIDGYLNILEEYQECLQTSLDTGQQVGVCDTLHSIYTCDFFWRQSLPAVKYALPEVVGSLLGKNVRGGGEYLNVQDSFDKASDSVTFFTQYYAAESFKAFQARSVEGVGTEVCRNWLSVPGMDAGKLFDALIAPDSPSQFLGWFDEIPYTTATEPPISHYKVFYHVYAGQDFPAQYEVYLKGDSNTLPWGVPERKLVGKGFIEAGERVQETEDFTAASGYNELCIMVNNQEECGFKQVSTDFAVQYLSDKFAADEASRTDITTEQTCISGNPNLLSLVSPNIQSGVEEIVNPEIYNRGIIRVCSTDNPGLSTDPNAGTENARWQEVGYCDTSNMKCWLDTKSVENAVDITTLEDKALGEVEENWISVLKKDMNLIEDFGEFVKELKNMENDGKHKEIITKINENFDRVFFSHEKGYLTLFRANSFATLAKGIFSTNFKEDGDGADTIPKVPGQEIVGSKIIYPALEFKSGGLWGVGGRWLQSSLFLRYVDENKWFWCKDDCSDDTNWYSSELAQGMQSGEDATMVQIVPELSERNKDFVNSLTGKDYLSGLSSLIQRTIKKEDTSPKLITEKVEFTPDKMFVVSQTEATPLYFEFDSSSNIWQWSPDKSNWMPVPEITVSGGEADGKQPVQDNINLIRALENVGSLLEGAEIIFSIDTENPPVSQGGVLTGLTCSTTEECQKVLGNEIIRIAREIKKERGISDDSVEENTDVKNFECLVLMLAMTESTIQHCSPAQKDGNPLYCDGKSDGLLKGDEGSSFGVMQINKDNHGEKTLFEENVRYGINYLANNYNPGEKIYNCYRPQAYDGRVVKASDFEKRAYSGWKRALRTYNGWNTNCYVESGGEKYFVGNPHYVEDVLDTSKDKVVQLFPGVCGA